LSFCRHIFHHCQFEFQEKFVASAWQRSVFNGLAQIIIQSTREPGEIKLTAGMDGLSPVTASVSSPPCMSRLVML
jgi:hypothetical protein